MLYVTSGSTNYCPALPIAPAITISQRPQDYTLQRCIMFKLKHHLSKRHAPLQEGSLRRRSGAGCWPRPASPAAAVWPPTACWPRCARTPTSPTASASYLRTQTRSGASLTSCPSGRSPALERWARSQYYKIADCSARPMFANV